MDAPAPTKPLIRIGAIIRRAGASLWSAIRSVGQALRAHSGLRVALLAGALLALMTSFAETLRERFDAVVTALQIDDREGIILIDTPQLYTRERLVNDRFRESAWLQERLDETDHLVDSGRFRQPNALFQHEHRAGFSVGAPDAPSPTPNDGNPGSSASPARAASDSNGFPPSVATEPTPLDELDDIARYREAIRNAFMATQLDDRHDIAGNTIYRLNFEAIVVPEHGARKLAAIRVTLSGPQEHSPYYLELLEDWRDELQRQVIDLVDDRVETIERGVYLPPSEQARLGSFLESKFKKEDRTTETALTEFIGRYLDREDQGITVHYNGFFNEPLDPPRLQVLRHQLCQLSPEIDSIDLPDQIWPRNQDRMPGDASHYAASRSARCGRDSYHLPPRRAA